MRVPGGIRKAAGVLFLTIICVALGVVQSPAEEVEFTFKSSFDGTEQKAVAYIPDSIKGKDKVSPLVVVAHFMGGNRYTARTGGYYPECDARGWLVVCPELHGLRTPGPTSMASLGAQHDIIDSIEYMKTHYKVDASRIYCVGRSMGGMMGGVIAAKYPDVFAAVLAGQGIYDLKLWTETTIPHLRAASDKECLPYSEATRFDYERRSAVSYASNLAYVPLILWHGTWDTWVPPEQAEVLTAAIRRYNRFQPDPNWLQCACHCPQNFDVKWELDRFTQYQNVCEANFGTPTRFFPELNITTDEAKSFYWLGIIPANANAFARVRASLRNDTLSLMTENVNAVNINLDQVSKLTTFSKFTVQSDGALRLTVSRGGKTLFESTEKAGALPKMN
ncbi:MAG: alpha/beta hydrolase family protein [Candidatus Latescibacterota bacterium]